MSDRQASGAGLGRRMARGTIAQQVAQGVSMVAGLAAATVLARELSLSEFGVYGLVVSFSTYLYFAVGSVETATLTILSAAIEPRARAQKFTAAVGVYGLLGLVGGALVAGGGTLLLPLLVDGDLLDEAKTGVVWVGVALLIGWPAKATQVLLRAEQRFGLAALCEAIGAVALSATLVALVVSDAPLWALIAVGASMSLFVGVAATVAAWAVRLRRYFRPGLVDLATAREVLRVAGSLVAISASDIAINQLDRTVLAAFRSPAVIGLYEGAVRVAGFVRTLASSFGVTLLPVLSRLNAEGDAALERQLLVRGTKYILAVVVPVTVAAMVFADRILALWLGEEFAEAGTAAVIFLAWWLLAPNVAFANSVLTVDRKFRALAAYAWGVALLNIMLSVALTAAFGLEGVAIGTTAAYTAAMPFYLRYFMRRRALSAGDYLHAVWVPAYGLGAALAGVLLALRVALSIEGAAGVLALFVLGPVAYWAVFYRFLLDESERNLVRRIFGLG